MGRAEPELRRVQTCLGRSREAEKEKLYFPKQSDVKFLSNGSWESGELSQGISLLSAMGRAFLSLGWERVQQGARFSLGIKMLCVIAWNIHQEKGNQ